MKKCKFIVFIADLEFVQSTTSYITLKQIKVKNYKVPILFYSVLKYSLHEYSTYHILVHEFWHQSELVLCLAVQFAETKNQRYN